MPLEAFALFDIQTGTVGDVPDRVLSDHLPVSSSTALKQRKLGSLSIPYFVMQNLAFQQRVSELTSRFRFDACCWARVAQVKEIFRIAYAEYLEVVKPCGATLAKERIFWCLQGLRASFTRDISEFEEALDAFW